MSIPPLVCNTPPPPEQCVDDKDPEDYDLQYSIPQDDEGSDYDFGSFSTYSHFQSSIQENQKNELPNEDKENHVTNCGSIEQSIERNKLIVRSNETSEHECRYEEEVNIEDLNLTVDDNPMPNFKEHHVDNIPVLENSGGISSENFINSMDSPEILKQNSSLFNVQNKSERSHSEVGETLVDQRFGESDLAVIISENTPNIEKVKDDLNEIEESPAAIDEKTLNQGFSDFYNDVAVFSQLEPESDTKEFKNALNEIKELNNINVDERMVNENFDEFPKIVTELTHSEHDANVNEIKDSLNEMEGIEEFNDFQFKSVDSPLKAIVDNCNDPWESTECMGGDFGDFKANFEESIVLQTSDELTITNSNLTSNIERQDLDDDFDEFDDFKSSDAEVKATETHTEQVVPVLNYQSDNENQVIESTSDAICTIFDQEIAEESIILEDNNFESLLSETWHHIKNVDVRQPYMVIWNNSLGQKTLLKALCIDSRNILFGPKWSYNMPIYATNLSTAPLQPLKQSAPAIISQSEIMTSEKGATKVTDSWTDPFETDGQEFTYAEALLLDLEHLMATLDQMAHNHSSFKISELLSQACSTETEVPTTEKSRSESYMFDAPPKTEKIFSNTPNIQPLRHINLPDTHIFTPTDSETPRSKTIHYDSVPSVLLPQTVKKDDKIHLEISNISKQNENTNEYQYSDFEDFQSSTNPHEVLSTTTKHQSLENHIDPIPKTPTAVIFQTQILQPVKLEPIIPTVNWPDPGEVKQTYEDFTDFISNSSWDKDKQSSTVTSTSEIKTGSSIIDRIGAINDKTIIRESPKNDDAFDDDFDTFQSAPAEKKSDTQFNSFNINTSHNTSLPNHTSSTERNNMGYTPTKIGNVNVKAESISFASIPKTSEIKQNKSTSKEDNVSKFSESSTKTSPIHSFTMHSNTLLQPMPATSHISNAGQILQPLSLESYSQINWPNPGIDLHDLSKFNPVETLQSLKTDSSVNLQNKAASPVHSKKSSHSQPLDDDVWGEFVSSKPSNHMQLKKSPAFADDDEWTDFVSSPVVKPQNGLSTISLNVHTNLNLQKSSKNSKAPLDIPTLNYITPKTNNYKSYNKSHFQNL